MDLILWRHAHAVDGSPDDARDLSERGEKDAALVGGWLAKRLPEGTATVLSSPTRRTCRTADALGMPYRTVEALGPGTTPERVVAETGWPRGRAGTLIVVGHNPWIGQVAALLLSGEPVAWPTRKGGFWWLSAREAGDVLVKAVISPEMLR